MELQEAISHARDIAEGKHPGIESCSECAKEHAQLADWLEELQECRFGYMKPEDKPFGPYSPVRRYIKTMKEVREQKPFGHSYE